MNIHGMMDAYQILSSLVSLLPMNESHYIPPKTGAPTKWQNRLVLIAVFALYLTLI
jgi:hypothetical protein